MKVGILTFHIAKNYGAMLQCYALVNYLRSQGFEAVVLDYRPSYLLGNDRLSLSGRLKSVVRPFIYSVLTRGEVKPYDAYDDFHSRYIKPVPMSEACTCDFLVTGSDQVWSPDICYGLDPVFFCQLEGCKAKRVSYAASSGNVTFTDAQRDFLKYSLKGFHAVSVREQSLHEQLSSLSVGSTVVLDPVLMADPAVFESLVTPVPHRRPYVLVYELAKIDRTYILAHKIARQLDADVVVINGGFKRCFDGMVKNRQNLSPVQFVSYFKHAACVVTTSFHGTAFSVLFEKPFYSIRMHTVKDDRILSLLGQLNLLSRSADKVENISYQPIDYSEPRQLLTELRSQSQQFILQALHS